MDPVKAEGKKKNLSARLERRKKWWSVKKNNTRLTRANAPKEEKVSQGQETGASTTVSSRGFTSTNNTSFTSTKPRQNLSKHDISGGKNSFNKGAKNQKHKSRPSGKKIMESPHKNDKMKQKNEKTPEKEGEPPLPEVTLVRSFNTAETEMEPSMHSPKKYVLFVGNLPYTVTREQVEEHFKKTGGVKAVRIPKEKGTEKGKGFAYVEFNSHISHRIALRLHNTTLGGRRINVEFTSAGGKNEMRLQKLRAKNEKLCKFKMPFDT